MTWNEDLPDNSTKIRVYPQVLTDNWKAIQAGDPTLKYRATNFIDRSTASEAPATTPTRDDDTMIMYSKNDGTNTELFILNDQNPADDLQITQVKALGSTSTPLNASSISFDVDPTTGLTYTDGQFIVAFGKFNSSGVLQFGKNMTTSGAPHPATGLYNIDVNADVLQNANYIITGVVTETGNSGGSIRGVMPLLTPAPVASTTTTIQLEIKRDGGRTNTFTNFQVMICGGR